MTHTTLIDHDAVGQLLAEGLELCASWSPDAHPSARAMLVLGLQTDPLAPMRELAIIARDALEARKDDQPDEVTRKLAVTYSALSGLLSCYGVEV